MAEKMITRTFSETVASYSVMKAGKWSKDQMVTLPGALTRGDVMNYILDMDREAETCVVKALEVKYTVYGMSVSEFKAAAHPVERPASQMVKAARATANTSDNKEVEA